MSEFNHCRSKKNHIEVALILRHLRKLFKASQKSDPVHIEIDALRAIFVLYNLPNEIWNRRF